VLNSKIVKMSKKGDNNCMKRELIKIFDNGIIMMYSYVKTSPIGKVRDR